MEAGDGRWGQVAAGLPCLLELETDTMGNAMRWTRARVTSFTRAQVINLCGPKQVQSVDYLLRAASISRLAGCVSALKCKIGPNSGLMHLQHPAVRRQTLSLQSEKRLSGSGECFKFSQAGVSLSLSGVLLSHRFRQKLWAGASSPSQDSGLGRERHVQAGPASPELTGLKA